MEKDDKILVVGAGPSGLASALFLSERGIKTRIIEKNNHISRYSKALGVNPRTLQLLETSGLTGKFLDKGRKMEKINIWKGDKPVYQNDLSKISHRYPFMLILPQLDSEAILLEELNRRSIEVEFGTSFRALKAGATRLDVVLSPPNHQTTVEEAQFSLLIGADGTRSKVREQIGIPSVGFQYSEDWELYDVELDVSLNRDEGHVRLFREGGMILIRLRDNIWRVAGNLKSLFSYLPHGSRVGEIVWKSTFRISHRVAEELFRKGVVLIGDAAHIHSPVGARGMNLGIEDAYVVSQLVSENRIQEYTGVREIYLKRTVRRINAITQGLAGDSFLPRLVRTHIDWFKFAFPLAVPFARKFIMGLNK